MLRSAGCYGNGIVNGVDYEEWSPQTDKFVAAKYSPQDLSGKQKCKQDLLNAFGVTSVDAKRPVIGIVSRFVAQKGFDLIAQIMDRLAREEMIVVVLGTGDKPYEEMFQRLNKQFPNKIAIKVAYDNAIAHKIEAGADMFLMPSRYEPCGLNQIYSLKYGTVPDRARNGRARRHDRTLGCAHREGNWLQIHRIHRRGAAGDDQAGAGRLRDQSSWQTLMRNGMARDFSWGASAREYGKVYERARQIRAHEVAAALTDLSDEPVRG